MTEQPQLTEDEWALIRELLQHERGDLPSEIRHTRTASLRSQLQARRKMVDALLEKLSVSELV